MDKNMELLNYIYQNAEAMLGDIDNIRDKLSNEKLKDLMRNKREDYLAISKEAIQIFIKYGKKETEIGKLEKIGNYLSTMFKTLTDETTSNVAKVLSEGINKNMLEITKMLNAYNDEDEEIKNLALKLQVLEENNLESLKEYL